LIYFDNAATTFPKPVSVVNEMVKCMTTYCGNPGRSGHFLSMESAKRIYDCREKIADLFGSSVPTNVVFTYNTTYAINTAIRAFTKKRGHVLISDLEHNSVYRPVCALEKNGIDHSIFTVYPNDDDATLHSIRSKIRQNTNMLVCTHVSNVCGITLPIEKIGRLCKQYGIKFIVDSAQGAGSHKIDINKCNIDALCCPGHKGLYGPQGTGFILFNDVYSDEKQISKTNDFIYGGNGVNSAMKSMPVFLPEKYEGGTLNTVGIAGLLEGVSFVCNITEEEILYHCSSLYKKALEMLHSLPNVVVYCDNIKESSCLLFNVKRMLSDNVAEFLSDNGICTRGGLHCSPLAHRKLGTENGAVRVSFSYFNNLMELEHFYKVMKGI